MLNFIEVPILGSLIMVFSGMWSFFSHRKHLLNSLLSLEFMVLGVFLLLSIHMVGVGSEMNFSLFFLTLAACEGALGLSLLILSVRSYGNDRFLSFNLLEC
uniref:NADH-ubiquinone oxidoreductase chain 4L n=3 Tax=Matutidae TaxID=761932 RepID=A0A345HHZ5_MATPL|nr:NADH dehydrogenase subunit 4L [Ashtoret lunaris]YP_009513722.1 NADH dehydrogenase subunit 4L [Matuta planipes]YP_010021633.1 NADH dehydrogenase subunit 4L [Matuta victor]AXG76235.1 NADH dehydrogenase subunit 4L [Matuta planipes]QIA95919.1 NADH dehydrogenase subunit 4L [Matuta planipes]QOL10574.1 NADH dehydrogenase subunit 4L [Matuta victor]CDR98378.1 NADH dehydrogenase subunit 4L [Ashtoret lunaris]